MTSIVVDKDNTVYDSRNNCNAIIESSSNTLVLGCNTTKIPNSVTSIGYCAFCYCSGLTSVTIPNSVISIGYCAFDGCSGLTSVTIGNSVESIGEFAFSDCSGLTSVTIGNSVESIGEFAFSDCSGLTSVTIPNSVTSIGYRAFYDCSSLKLVINLSNLNIISGSSGYGYVAYYADRVVTGDFIDGDYVWAETDGEYTLVSYLGNETNLVLPDGYNGKNYAIGEYAFYKCSGLTSVTITNSVTSIGDCAFEYCSGLTSIEIPNSVTSIGDDAFRYCSGLKLVINLSDLNIISGSSGNGYVAYYADRVVTGDFIDGDYVWAETDGEYTLVSYLGNETNLVLPDGYNGKNYAIGSSAFAYCSGLTSVTIPNSVTSIGSYAFYGCSLKSLTIGTGVLSIGSDQSKPVKTIWQTNTPPNGYANLNGTVNYTINNQYRSLSNVTIYPYLSSAFEADGVKYVPVSPTERTCDAIDCNYDSTVVDINIGKTVSFKGVEMKVQNVMPYTVYGQTSVKTLYASPAGGIGDFAFYGCSGITKAVIYNNGRVGNNAFELCTSLKTMTLGDGVSSIGNRAFKGCGSLEKFSVGKNIKTFGDEVFFDCSVLTELSCRALLAPTCGNQTFICIDMWGCTLKIPEGTTPLYQSADQWKAFFFMEDVLESPKFEVEYMIDGVVVATDSVKYGKSITLKDAPAKDGHTFVGWENVPETMPANDITITGSYKVNTYAVKYVLDNEAYATDSVAYGSAITLRDEPTKEGYTFLGWSEAPETMPANDITINGSFKVNSYAVKYIVDGETITTDSVEYGAVVNLIDELEKEGYSFSWSEAPETMPANDITITGEWSINSYLVTFIVDGEVYATDSVEYGAAITLPEVPEKENSTFAWEGEIPTTMPANEVTIYGNYATGIFGVEAAEQVDVYTISGMLYRKAMNFNELNRELPRGLYIVNGKKYLVK